MRASLQRYGPVAGVAAAFLVLFVLLAPSMLARDTRRDHSAFRKNAWGCAALAELCRRGRPALKVELLTRPLDDLGAVEGLLVILDPERPFAGAEVEEIVRWVEDGGTLLAAVEGVWADPSGTPLGRPPAFVALAERLGVQFPELGKPANGAAPAPGSRHTTGVRQVAIDTNEGVDVIPEPPNAEDTPELSADGTPVLVSFPRGRGKVVVSSDAHMFANGALGREDNLRFVADLLWRNAEAGSIYFDEYHHGFGPRVRVGSAPDPAPLHRALLVTAVGFAVFLVGRAQRFGRAVESAESRRRAPREYVEALAGLLARGEANRWALEKIAAAFRRRMAAAAGLPGAVADRELAEALAERQGIAAPETIRVLGELEAALGRPTVTSRRLAQLTQRVSDLEERVAGGSRGVARKLGGR